MFGLSTEATLTIVAVFAGPIVALLTQRALDHLRDRRGRRLTIFRVLMGTRAAALSQAHVDALNQIALNSTVGVQHIRESSLRGRLYETIWAIPPSVRMISRAG